MPKAKKEKPIEAVSDTATSVRAVISGDPESYPQVADEKPARAKTIDHSDPTAYHATQLARIGAGACDVCGKPVDEKPAALQGTNCTAKFHAEQYAAIGAGACSVCGRNVAA